MRRLQMDRCNKPFFSLSISLLIILFIIILSTKGQEIVKNALLYKFSKPKMTSTNVLFIGLKQFLE